MRRSSWSRRGIIVGSASLLLLPGARAASAQPTRRRPKVAFLLPTAPDDVDTSVDRLRAMSACAGGAHEEAGVLSAYGWL